MTDQRTTERIAELERKNAELAEALQLMLKQFTKTPSTFADSDARCKAHAALASHQKEDKAP